MTKECIFRWFADAKNYILPCLIGRYRQFVEWRKRHKVWRSRLVWYKRAGYYAVATFAMFLLYLLLVDINFLWLFGKSPDMSMLTNPQQNVASEIYSADGKLIGKYFRENRSPVKYTDISPIMIQTLVAVEDERFYSHFGIDVQGLFATAKDMMQGRFRGASTITQQLAKNMFNTRKSRSLGLFGHIPGVKILLMKTKEWIMAVKIEMLYSKREILTMYLNTVDFGSNAFGIKTAARTYFNTTPKNLTVEQAATLVGMLKATTYYNPRINPKNSQKRRNVVLESLMHKEIITKSACDSLKQIPIKLQFNVEENYDGTALYFREKVAESLRAWCKENDVDIYSDGLKIYTTLDSRMQEYAEAAVEKQMQIVQQRFNSHWGREAPWRDENKQEMPDFIENIVKRTPEYKMLLEKYAATPDSVWIALNRPHRVKVFDYKSRVRDTTLSTMDSIRYMERFMHASFVAVEPQTGFVKAWVGDIDFNFWKYDKVTSLRQPGSTFKLFVYTTAFEQGLGPCDENVNSYFAWNYMEKGKVKTWIPRNATRDYTGETVTLKYAFARSFNTVAAKVAKDAGIENIIETACKMGVKSPLHNTPSTSLGSSDMSLLELTNAYCTVIDDGMAQELVLVAKILDRTGKVIYEHKPQKRQAISYETAFLMTQMLQAGLTEPFGTSQALWEYRIFDKDTEFGGKTGTSSNYSDAWYVGATPNLVAGSWVGGEHRCIHFRTGQLGEGGKTALPIFGFFMEKLLDDKRFPQYRAKFPKPKTKISKPYQCRTPYPTVRDTIDAEENDYFGNIIID